MKALTFLISMTFGLTAFGAGETYELVYSYYESLGEKMRKESIFEISKGGDRLEIQKRIYLDGKNELREASFYNADLKKWNTYPGSELPAVRKAELQAANNLLKKRVLEKPAEETTDLSASDRPNRPRPQPSNPNAIACEKAGNEFVICDGIPYRKERSGVVNGTSREVKVQGERRPAITGPFEDESGTAPAP